MGQALSEPNTEKTTASCQSANFQVGSSSMQGWRTTMEDSHTHILSLPLDPDASFFAVFDGHDSEKVSEFAAQNLHTLITSRKEYKNGNIEEAMKQAFLDIDTVMLEDDDFRYKGGSTACALIIKGNVLYCANAGDSRAVACVKGEAKALSVDHKPYNEGEYERIVAAGGEVFDERVNGSLALSRALGDFCFKRHGGKSAEEQMVTAYPDVQTHSMTPDWEFLVVACDGIWDVMTNEKVVSYVRERIAKGTKPEEICENLMMSCLSADVFNAAGFDNMTVVIIGLLQGIGYKHLSSKCNRVYNE